MNSSFSTEIPNLQIAWDSTSLGSLKTCPRYYQLAIVEGWQPRRLSVHLIFGLHYHAALERYDHSKFAGASHEEATLVATRYALEATWENNRPWISDDPYKNRFTLVRSIVWYLDQFADDSIETIRLANGKPAVELSFRFETDYFAPDGQTYMLCGHLDRLGEFNGKKYVVDRKTSKSAISSDFFDKFNPDNQMTLYTLAANIVYSMPVEGVIIDGAQVAVGFSRFQRGLVTRHKSQLDEWYGELSYWFGAAEHFARLGHWPQNDKACGNYGGCQFRNICSKSPSVREEWLSASFTKRVWDPLLVRGDI